jgi:hypothetical protein
MKEYFEIKIGNYECDYVSFGKDGKDICTLQPNFPECCYDNCPIRVEKEY